MSQAHFKAHFERELNEHPELRTLEDPSSSSFSVGGLSTKDGSVAPSTVTNSTETPQPSSAPAVPAPAPTQPTRIKLVSSSTSYNNAAASSSSGTASTSVVNSMSVSQVMNGTSGAGSEAGDED